MGKAGAHLKYTVERVQRVLDSVRAGLTYEHAALAAGVSADTLAAWRQGRQGADADFAERFAKAEGEAALGLMLRIRKQSDEDWRAAAWILEHRYPQHYGKTAVEHSGPDGQPLVFTLTLDRPPALESDDANA